MKRLFKIYVLLLLFVSCQKNTKNEGLIARDAMVVSAREEASKIGLEILKQGGNAFDAMVATELALAVAYPYAGNLGGGGFMIYRKSNGETGALDYREKAPLAAHKDMYLDTLGNVIPGKSTMGPLAVGIPGTVAGVFAVHEKFGTLSIAKILQPVIELAQKGVVVTQKQEARLLRHQENIIKVNGAATLFANTFKARDTIKYLALANTLQQLAEKGSDVFYKGDIAQKLVDFIQDKGGIISMEDMAKYKAKWREPIHFNYKDLNIISMSPPSSGGITLAQILKMIEPYQLSDFGHNNLKTIQVITEAERRAYADRNYFLGDPDFVAIPKETLLDKTYLKARMKDFSFESATPSNAVTHGSISVELVESNETTHYSIVDPMGNAVAVTTTLNSAYGSKLYCDALGFFLNNEMDDFSAKPGVPNAYGLVGAAANSIAPEKRMLSSMTPTIIEKEGTLWMVVGTPGGSTIITSVLQAILNVHAFGMSMQQAVNAPRFHHQWLPDVITFEPDGFSEELLEKLKNKNYGINQNNTPVIGKVDAILIRPDGTLEGGADRRGDDTAVGF